MEAEDHTTALALLDERRVNLTQTRVRAVNQLHTLLRTLRPAGPVEHARKQLAEDLVADIRRLDAQLAANARLLEQAVTEAGSTLMDTPGIGPVMTARLIARTGRAGRFATGAAFASYCGTAPIEIASAGRARHRLSRSGDRQLNAVLHTIAIIQIRMPNTAGRAYYDRKIAEGKAPRKPNGALNAA